MQGRRKGWAEVTRVELAATVLLVLGVALATWSALTTDWVRWAAAATAVICCAGAIMRERTRSTG